MEERSSNGKLGVGQGRSEVFSKGGMCTGKTVTTGVCYAGHPGPVLVPRRIYPLSHLTHINRVSTYLGAAGAGAPRCWGYSSG